MTISDLKEVVSFFKKEKVQAWNIDGFEGTFHPTAFQEDIAALKPEGFKELPDDDLYYSAE